MHYSYRIMLKLAYKDLSLEEKKRDEAMKNMDPKKREQMERLGMGAIGSRVYNTYSFFYFDASRLSKTSLSARILSH